MGRRSCGALEKDWLNVAFWLFEVGAVVDVEKGSGSEHPERFSIKAIRAGKAKLALF
tara:strand:- start:758 stop:928 length:171 start_codon:yes stop_codon:yes gene_type:complete